MTPCKGCTIPGICKRYGTCQDRDTVISSDDGTMKDFYFTFGFGQHMGTSQISLRGCYTIIRDWTFNGALKTMVERRGNKWASDYGSAEEAGVDRYGLTFIPFNEVLPQEGPTK